MTDLLRSGGPRSSGIARRVRALLEVLDRAVPDADASLESALEEALQPVSPERIWLALAVLTAQLPDAAAVVRTTRKAKLDGTLAALRDGIDKSRCLDETPWPEIEVVRDVVLIDVHHTSHTPLRTGIQRVVREAVTRWQAKHELVLAGWTESYTALRRLDAVETQAVCGDGIAPEVQSGSAPRHVARVIPWKCTIVVPELAAEPERAKRYLALAKYSGSRTGAIGFDCVPLTAPETAAEGMSGAFSSYLAAVANFDAVAAISDAAAAEYEGWRSMLAGSGRQGPEVRSIPLAVEHPVCKESALREAQDLLMIGQLPIVLVVGSHEPRKNHLAILQAAEVLWREGHLFTLTFVGGNAWKSGVFEAQVQALQGLGRPVQIVLALPEELLWAAYLIAYCTVFVSNHEGYGLPVAESLASGTPVVTSNFGSMRQLAGRGGAICVDPHDDDDIASALRRLLLNQSLRNQLAEDAAKLEWRAWDDYAKEAWDFLTVAEALPLGNFELRAKKCANEGGTPTSRH